jgi:hypothetical protein
MDVIKKRIIHDIICMLHWICVLHIFSAIGLPSPDCYYVIDDGMDLQT